MELTYFPGCTLKQKASGFDVSARAVFHAMGIELREMPEWNCCGAAFPLTVDNLLPLAAPARILAEARKSVDQLAVACATCWNVLRRTNRVIREETEKRDRLNTFIEASYTGDLRVIHLLTCLRDSIGFAAVRRRVVVPLRGLRVATYYGCMLLRPPAEVDLDDPEDPRVLEDLSMALGADPVVFPHRGECCGAYLLMKAADAASAASHRILESAKQAGAELMVTSCPLCQFNLDRDQGQMMSQHPGYRLLPVVYFTQLMGIAFGQDTDGYRLGEHYVDPRPLLAPFLFA